MGQNSIRDYNAGSSGRAIESARLDSWKEIASYLHRDARTVRRWERERRLPVHRVPGGERSGVFAYVSELEQWLRATDVPVALPPPEMPEGGLASTFTRNSAPGDFPSISQELLAPGEILLVAPAISHEETGSEMDVSRRRAGDVVEFPLDRPAAQTITERRRQTDSPALTDGVNSAIMQAESSRWAVYAMAGMLIFAIVAGSSFAFVHYRRFHLASAEVHGPSAEAQELYLRGRYCWNLRTEEGLNQAVDFFTQSIVNDPRYAPAYAGLADSYLLLRQYGHMPDAEAYPRALAAARQAVMLDAASPDAHRSIAFILRFWNWDMPSAEREYLRAIELDPKNSQSHHWYATALLSSGRVREALEQIDIARLLEPQSVSVLADRGLILSFEDRARGEEALKQVAQSQPEFPSTHVYLSNIYLDLGNYAEFLSQLRTVATLKHDAARIELLDQARKDLETHGPQFMLRNLATEYAHLAERGQAPAYFTARLFGLTGDSAQALRFLQLACDRRDPGFLSVASDAAFRHVRSSPEYIALLARRDATAGSRREPIARLDRISPF